MSAEISYHFGHLLQVKKKLFVVWFYTIFFHDFIPGAGADKKFWCQQEHLVTSVICCKFKNNLFVSLSYTFFHDFIHLYSLRAWGRQPRGDKVLVSTEMSCHFIHLLKVSKNFLEARFYTIFSWFNMYIAPGQGQTALGGKILMSTERPYHFTHLLQDSKKSLKSCDFIQFFFHDLIQCI